MAQIQSLLADLPSRGHFTAVQPGLMFPSVPTPYIASHNTAPPEDQVIQTDPTSILIRALQSRKAREEGKRKQHGKAADKGKRALDDAGNSARSAKRTQPGEAHEGVGPSGAGASGSGPLSASPPGTTQPQSGGPGQGGASAGPSGTVPPPASSRFSRLSLLARTIRDLQSVLKAWGLPVSGKKDDLVTRILDEQTAACTG